MEQSTIYLQKRYYDAARRSSCSCSSYMVHGWGLGLVIVLRAVIYLLVAAGSSW